MTERVQKRVFSNAAQRKQGTKQIAIWKSGGVFEIGLENEFLHSTKEGLLF